MLEDPRPPVFHSSRTAPPSVSEMLVDTMLSRLRMFFEQEACLESSHFSLCREGHEWCYSGYSKPIDEVIVGTERRYITFCLFIHQLMDFFSSSRFLSIMLLWTFASTFFLPLIFIMNFFVADFNHRNSRQNSVMSS